MKIILATAMLLLLITPSFAAGNDIMSKAEQGDKEAIRQLLETYLFRNSGGTPDPLKAKYYADIARNKGISLGYGSKDLYETVDECARVANSSIPPKDEPSAQEKKSYSALEEPCLNYHYGFGLKKDDVAYRKCLLSTKHTDKLNPYDEKDFIPAPRLLAEIYVNGWGVQKNTDIATNLLCRSSDVPNELIDIVSGIKRSEENSQENFDFCGYASSGFTSSLCANKKSYIQSKLTDNQFFKYKKNWSLETQERFNKLLKRLEDFANNEAIFRAYDSYGGTGYTSFVINYNNDIQNKEFIYLLKDVETKNLEIISAKKYVLLDAKLNKAYQYFLSTISNFRDSACSSGDKNTCEEYKKELKDAQREWIKYRDAWADFYAARFEGQAKQDDLKRLGAYRLTQQRLRQFQTNFDMNANE